MWEEIGITNRPCCIALFQQDLKNVYIEVEVQFTGIWANTMLVEFLNYLLRLLDGPGTVFYGIVYIVDLLQLSHHTTFCAGMPFE